MKNWVLASRDELMLYIDLSAAAADCKSFSETHSKIRQSAQNWKTGFVRFLYYPMDTFEKTQKKVSGRPYTPGILPLIIGIEMKGGAQHDESAIQSFGGTAPHLSISAFLFAARCAENSGTAAVFPIFQGGAGQAGTGKRKNSMMPSNQREKQRVRLTRRTGGKGAIQPVSHLPAVGL